jgi:putative SOS response-associated peptidase YedK
VCYTIEKKLTRAELEKRFGSKFKPNRPDSPGKRVSAYSLPDVPVIASTSPEEIDSMIWGLIPFWVKDEDNAAQIRMKTFNARAESLTEKPSYKHTLRNQRCLVLTNGFYEWQHRGKEKIPYFISLKDDIAMPMAGLFDRWTNKKTGELLETFTIITIAANPLMEKIHNTKKRMPVILQGGAEKQWTDPLLSQGQVMKLLKPLDEKLMLAEELDRDLFSGKKKDEGQGKLF